MMTTNLFVIANLKQLQTQVVLEFYFLFFQTSWGVGVLNSLIFNSFHNWVQFGTILEGLRNLRGFEPPPPKPPSVHHWARSVLQIYVNQLFYSLYLHDYENIKKILLQHYTQFIFFRNRDTEWLSLICNVREALTNSLRRVCKKLHC